eukprot:3091105-Amphidinium_carterae.1
MNEDKMQTARFEETGTRFASLADSLSRCWSKHLAIQVPLTTLAWCRPVPASDLSPRLASPSKGSP